MIYFIIFLIILMLAFLVTYIWLLPRLKIAAGYRAKYEGSHDVLSNLSEKRIHHALNFFPVKYFSVKKKRHSGTYRASLLGLASQEAHLYTLGPSMGFVMGRPTFEKTPNTLTPSSIKPNDQTWPMGDARPAGKGQEGKTDLIQNIAEKFLQKDFGIHAITVANKTDLLAEAYNPGVDATSRLLGWSMTKTMANALIGILARQGKINAEDAAPIPEWARDPRQNITIRDLLQMQSGLSWSEDYGNVSDVTNMLYREADCFRSSIDNFFAPKPNPTDRIAVEQFYGPGEVFNYSSGTSNILSGIIRSCFDRHEDYLNFPKKELFGPLGMDSALIEVDPSGNYILSSYAWATARDWTRFGLLYLYRGNWSGKEIFSDAWYRDSVTPASQSNSRYGYHLWLNTVDNDGKKELSQVPEDAFYEEGVFGQRILIVPSRDLVISVFSGMMDGKVFETFYDDLYGEILENLS